VEKLTIEDGLSQGMIFDILQSRKGFIWVATKDGLNRYDGYNFKVYTNDPFNPYSIAENTVTALYEDSRGWLWIGTQSKGLDLFDPHSGRFHHFPMNFEKVFPGAGAEVTRIQETPDGAIWVLKFGIGLIKVNIPDAWKEGLPEEPMLEYLAQVSPMGINLQASEKDWLHGFFVLRNGKLLVTSIHKMFVLDVKNGHYQPIHEGLVSCELNGVVLGSEEHGGDLWVGDLKQIARIRQGKATAFHFPAGADIQYSGLHDGENGHVWCVVNNRVWDLAPGEDFDFDKPDLVLDVNPNCITKDNNGNLWLGTVGYGLRKFNPAKSLFHPGARGVSLTGLWRSPTGQYFCKARISYTSIFPYDTLSGNIGKKSAFPDAPLQQISMAFEPDGTSWLLCTSPEMNFQGMLRRYDPAGRLVKAYLFGTKLNLSDLLFRSSEGLLWIAGNDGQLIRFDPRTGRFDYFSFAHLFAEQASAVRSTALAEDGQGQLWAGTQLGLVKCTPKGPTFAFELIKADGKKPNGLNNNSIACLLPDPADPSGILWIGTKGGGLNRFDQRSGQFLYLTTTEGMPNNVVYGILPGGSKEFWCSTNRGLAKITAKGNAAAPEFEITSYTAATGLQDNEFNSFAFFKTDKGELLFGGVNGLNRFFPGQLKMDTIPPPVYIVGLEINHKKAGTRSLSIPLSQPIERLRELRLKYDQNNLSFEFAALDFTDPGKNRYRYQLVGLDNEWVENSHLRFAHFNHLAPGTYEFRVQASNGESPWAEAMPIKVVILPPWWRTNLAYLCYSLLVIWLGWRAYLFQIRRVKEREQLAFELREKERVKALEQMKTDFFSNVTHEFRTPLTLIIEPLRQLLNNPEDPDRKKKIRLAEKNSRQLLSLVNQLLDMAKIESGSMAVEPRRADIGQLVRNTCESFLPLAASRNIQFDIYFSEEIPEFEFDPGKVELVLNNLISNALKFTPEGGKVALSLSLKEAQPSGNANQAARQEKAETWKRATIEVKDTGIGIPPGELDNIFNRFYQVDGSHTRKGEGTGIGLALSKELAVLMGGGISVQSKLGEGSTFQFWLPCCPAATAPKAPQRMAPLPAGATSLESPGQPLAPNGERPVALVVEDNADLRAFIKQSIEAAWQVVEATNGREGIQKAIELVPDLVVSDLMMPEKDGYELCNELKNNELTAHVPIILLTAKSATESKIKGLRTGADDYLTKPFHTEELLVRMENLVAMRRKLRERYGSKPLAQPNGEWQDEGLSAPDREFLKRFTLLLEEHISDETLGVEDFANKMFISRSQLHRKLKAITDRSANEFIRDFRLEQAHALLSQGGVLIAEVAQQVGFANEKYFSTSFKEKYGLPPSQLMRR
jgi:signal transduction histidine kinase/DNA-binding response OmpR family regulator/ligand-binding sensor domain-containing protein